MLPVLLAILRGGPAKLPLLGLQLQLAQVVRVGVHLLVQPFLYGLQLQVDDGLFLIQLQRLYLLLGILRLLFSRQ